MNLKMCTTGKIYSKFIQKLLEMDQGRDGVRHEGKGEDSIFGGEDQSPPQSLLYLQIIISHKKHPEEGASSDYCFNFEKSERDYFSPKQ